MINVGKLHWCLCCCIWQSERWSTFPHLSHNLNTHNFLLFSQQPAQLTHAAVSEEGGLSPDGTTNPSRFLCTQGLSLMFTGVENEDSVMQQQVCAGPVEWICCNCSNHTPRIPGLTTVNQNLSMENMDTQSSWVAVKHYDKRAIPLWSNAYFK